MPRKSAKKSTNMPNLLILAPLENRQPPQLLGSQVQMVKVEQNNIVPIMTSGGRGFLSNFGGEVIRMLKFGN